MKATLRPQLAQSLNLTPQLLQSIRLLQLTAPQLEMELRQALERNPMLEQEEPEDEVDASLQSDHELSSQEAASWDELPEPSYLSGSNAPGGDGDGEDAMLRIAEGTSSDPRIRLSNELALHWSDRDLELASWWLDHCDDRGYLEQPRAELAAEGAQAFGIDADDFEFIRKRLLHGDWPGMAAVDAGECLQAQLSVLPADATTALAKQILTKHMDLLAAHDEAQLAVVLKATNAEVKAAVALILTLRAHPVQSSHSDDQHVVPDVVTWFAGGAWRVSLNQRHMPRIRVSAYCEKALSQAPGDTSALRGLLDEARWLVRGVAMRNETLLRTTQVLVERQQGFLERGDEAIAPLTLREVADAIGMHESTVSRVTTGKYIQTPRGTIELKRLFAVRLEGAEIGGFAVKAMVKRLIDAEPATAPLADDVIAGLLARQGIRIARRTVAKYRDQLSIAPARVRQRALSCATNG